MWQVHKPTGSPRRSPEVLSTQGFRNRLAVLCRRPSPPRAQGAQLKHTGAGLGVHSRKSQVLRPGPGGRLAPARLPITS